ncbi:MAG: PadR family transcriptional regulator [Candidatus Bathyarchaeum sp.]|nr:MAG: PadR family transcriptional regulator [Candidatus Bathyarchaeum sp.]
MFGPHRHFGHWMRHMAAVPKGFLRYYVLRLLNEKSMSGSEIMREIEERTDRHWRPSPGSIYPLLAWLHEKGYSIEVPQQEPGVKRYTLTEEGKNFLEEHVKRKKELRKRIGFFAPPFVGPRWFNHHPKEAKGVIEAGKKLVKSSWVLLDNLRQEYSEEAVAQATAILDDAARKIEEIAQKLEREEE